MYIKYLYLYVGSQLFLVCQGWHFDILTIDMYEPFKIPYFSIDSIAYFEHVGWNLHDAGNNGDIKYL